MVLTVESIKYILRHMMNTEWLPSFIELPTGESRKQWEADQRMILQILSQCQSKLEVMYFLGIGYYLHSNWARNGGGGDYPSFYLSEYQGQKGIHISEPFCGGKYDNGLSSLLVIPQYRSPEKPIHHDFGLFSGESNGGGPWHFFRAVEIEGYAVHRQRRKQDENRYTGLSYKVVCLHEETSNPLDWYQVFDPNIETGIPGEWCLGDEFEDNSNKPF